MTDDTTKPKIAGTAVVPLDTEAPVKKTKTKSPDDGPERLWKQLEKNVDKVGVYLVLLSVVIDILGVAMVVPILPFYATRDFGATPTQLGLLYSAFSATATASTLIMGTASDYFGRKNLLVISLFGSFSGFLFHGLANSYTMLLGARIYTGFFSSSMTVAQAYIADVIPKPLQPKYMANMGGAIGMTFMVGPTVGGAIAAAANNRYEWVYYIASIIAGLGCVYTAIRLVEPPKKDLDESDEDAAMKKADAEIAVIASKSLLSIPTVTYKLGIVRFLTQMGWSCYGSMFTLYMMNKYSETVTAVLISTQTLGGSFFYVLTTMFIFRKLVAKMGLPNSLKCGQAMMGVALCILPLWMDNLAGQWLTFVFNWMIMMPGFGIYMPGISSILARYTLPGSRGKVLGCASMFMSAADITAPLLFGVLYDIDDDHMIMWFVAAGCCALAVIVLILVDKCNLQVKIKADDDLEKAAGDDGHDWDYVPDREATDEDYLRLGKMIGDELNNRGWRWISKMDSLFKPLTELFMPIPEEVKKTKKSWDGFWDFFNGYIHHIQELRVEQEEAMAVLKESNYKFDDIRVTSFSQAHFSH